MLLTLTLGAGAIASDVPFTLNLSGSAPNPVGTTFQPGTSNGTISPFGAASASIKLTPSGSTAGMDTTFTIASGDSFTGTFTATAAPNSPTISFSGNISGGTGIFDKATGSVKGAINITNLAPPTVTQTLNYTVTGNGPVTIQDTGTAVTVSPGDLIFVLTENATTPAVQGLLLHNPRSAQANFSALTSTGSGGDWLAVSPSSGTVAQYGNTALTVTVDGSSLKAGVYHGEINFTLDSGSSTVFVEVDVGPAGVYLQLSQTGLTFKGNPSGTPPPLQTITVTNTGVGSLKGLTADASMLDEGPKWLSTNITSSTPSQVQVAISANLTGLKPGKHYGQVSFAVDGAPNSPQVATSRLEVLADEVTLEALFRAL